MVPPLNKDLCANHPPGGWQEILNEYVKGNGPEPDWCTCPPNPGYRLGNKQPMRKCRRKR